MVVSEITKKRYFIVGENPIVGQRWNCFTMCDSARLSDDTNSTNGCFEVAMRGRTDDLTYLFDDSQVIFTDCKNIDMFNKFMDGENKGGEIIILTNEMVIILPDVWN